MNFLQKFRDFVSQPTQSRTTGIVAVLFLLGAVYLTVITAQEQQRLKQRASHMTPVQACANWTSISDCPSNTSPNNPCSSEGSTCKYGDKVYECVKK